VNAEALALTGPHHAAESRIAAIVANWCDEHHGHGFSMCQEQPCLAVRLADREEG
jgi:hypothetical protein